MHHALAYTCWMSLGGWVDGQLRCAYIAFEYKGRGKDVEVLHSNRIHSVDTAGGIPHHRSSVWMDTTPFKVPVQDKDPASPSFHLWNKPPLGSESHSFTEALETQTNALTDVANRTRAEYRAFEIWSLRLRLFECTQKLSAQWSMRFGKETSFTGAISDEVGKRQVAHSILVRPGAAEIHMKYYYTL